MAFGQEWVDLASVLLKQNHQLFTEGVTEVGADQIAYASGELVWGLTRWLKRQEPEIQASAGRAFGKTVQDLIVLLDPEIDWGVVEELVNRIVSENEVVQ